MTPTYLFESLLNRDIRLIIYECILRNHTIDISEDSNQDPFGSLLKAMPAIEAEILDITIWFYPKMSYHYKWGVFDPETTIFTCKLWPENAWLRLRNLILDVSLENVRNVRIYASKTAATEEDRTGNIFFRDWLDFVRIFHNMTSLQRLEIVLSKEDIDRYEAFTRPRDSSTSYHVMAALPKLVKSPELTILPLVAAGKPQIKIVDLLQFLRS